MNSFGLSVYEPEEEPSYIVKYRGKEIKVWFDDPGQCLFFQYKDDNGELVEDCCGAYNFAWLEYIVSKWDPKGVMVSEFGIEWWDEQTEELLKRWEEHDWIRQWPDDYTAMVKRRNREDYGIYDFDKLYKIVNETGYVEIE